MSEQPASVPNGPKGRRASIIKGILSIALAAAAVVALPEPVIMAQEQFGNFIGVVRDPSGAVLPDTTVTLTNKQNNRVFTTQSDNTGAFVFRQVEPGHYRLMFQRTGFDRFEVQDAAVSVGQSIKIDANLRVGSAQQTVEVTEAAPLIDTTTVLKATTLSAEEFNGLPKTRSFQSLAAFSPSVNSGTIEGGFQINGASGAENQFFVDGVTTNSLIDGRSRENAAFEFIQEIQVKTGGIDAEYGGATGGVINAVTRSGGNRFHGEAHYYYFGNAISAGPVQRLLLLDQFGAGNNPVYVQDHKTQNDTHEFGGSVGGYLLRDKLFFYSSVSPQIVRRSNDYLFSNGLEPDTLHQSQTNQQLFNKLTWVPINRVRANFSWLWTPTRTEGILPAFNGYGNDVITTRASAQPNKTQGWTQPQSNYSGQVDWTLTPTSILTFRGGRFWDNFRTWGVPTNSSVTFQTAPTGISGLPPELASAQAGYVNTPRTQVTNYDIATRTHFQVDFSKFVGSFFGSHDLKVGVGTQKNVNRVDVTYPGDGYVYIYFNQPFTQPGTGTRVGGQYGYYSVTNFGTRGSVGASLTNLYIQDHWRPIPRLSVTLGLRTENERVPSFNPAASDIDFGFSQKLSPRVGASWDLRGDGKLKVFGSYGRLYGWVPYDTARGSFGGDFYTIYYRSLDTLDVLSLSGKNKPGTNLWPSGAYRNLRELTLADPNLKPISTDSINVGIEYQIAASTVLRANYNRNNLVRTVEDMGVLVNGNETYQLVNPGEGTAKTFLSSGLTPNNFTTPKPQRSYDALELSVTRRFSKQFFASASYVYSRLYGNYSGLANSDEIQTPTTGVSSGTTQQSGGSVARPGTNGSRAYDLDETLFDSKGNILYGRLATDRPQVFKAFGTYAFKWGTEIGGFFLVESGTPVSTTVETVNQIPVFVNGRGDLGRTPVFSQTDLMVSHEVKLGEVKRLRFEFNAINGFNQKTSRHIYNQLNRGAATSSGSFAFIDLSNSNLFKGYDYASMLRNIASTGVNPYDPRFKMNDLFNTGFQGRAAVKFIF